MRNTYKKLEVLHFPDPRLRKIAKEVDTFDNSLQTLIDDMFFTMYEEKGIGLAATQVDIHKRIIVIEDIDTLFDERKEGDNNFSSLSK